MLHLYELRKLKLEIEKEKKTFKIESHIGWLIRVEILDREQLVGSSRFSVN